MGYAQHLTITAAEADQIVAALNRDDVPATALVGAYKKITGMNGKGVRVLHTQTLPNPGHPRPPYPFFSHPGPCELSRTGLEMISPY